MIFQDPLSSLHPYYRVGWQIAEMIHAHENGQQRPTRRKRAVELLGLVGIPQPDRRVDDFPHQFSGGMRQRAMIAMAMALNPELLIADEPTTALDVTVQAQVLEVMRRLQQEFGTAIILITHDLGVVADIADDVLVMYAGRAVEKADRRTTYYQPASLPTPRACSSRSPQFGGRRAADCHPGSAAEPDQPARPAAPSAPLPLRDGPLCHRGPPPVAGGRRRRGPSLRVLAAPTVGCDAGRAREALTCGRAIAAARARRRFAS